jgi:hypothetical protein
VFALVRDHLTAGGREPYVGSASRAVLVGLGFGLADIAVIERARDRGEVTRGLLEEKLSPGGVDLLDRLSFDPGEVVSVEVDVLGVLDPGADRDVRSLEALFGSGAAMRRFEGVGVMGGKGLRRLVLRPSAWVAGPDEGGAR